MPSVDDIVAEFTSEVKSLYSMYCGSLCAFKFARDFLDICFEKKPEFEDSIIGLTADSMLDSDHFLFQIPIKGDVYQASTDKGSIQHLVARAVVVWLYEMWEIKYRKAFSKVHGVEKEQIRSNFFGDLRHFRHCIIHEQAVANKKVSEELVLLPLQPVGEKLLIGFFGMSYIFQYALRTIKHLATNTEESFLREHDENFVLDYYDLSQNRPKMALSYPDEIKS